MKTIIPNRIDKAKEYIQEIKDTIENLDIRITSDFDLDSLEKAKNYLKAFHQKQNNIQNNIL